MKKIAVIAAIAVFAGFAFAASTRHAEAQQSALLPLSPPGRYTVTASPSASGVLVLLDTQTGRTWLFCDTKDDSVVSAHTFVSHNWCAMQVVGMAPRP